MFATRAGIRFRKVIEESEQKSNLQCSRKRKDITFSNPIHIDELDMLKEKSRISNPNVSSQIPPNISNMVEKTINNQQEPVLRKEQDKIPVYVEQSISVDKEPSVITQPPLVVPSFYRPPRKPPKEVPKPIKKRKHSKIMRLAEGMNLYDILTNMDSIQPQITVRQLLAVAPCCRSELSAFLIWKRAKIVDVHDISMDPGAPTVDVFIDGFFIQGAQIDSGSSVNLMSAETMEEIG